MRRWGIVAGTALVTAALVLPTVSAGAADLPNANVHLRTVATKSRLPLALVWRPGSPSTMYVLEQHTGRVRPIVNGKPKGKLVKVKVSQGGEQGLLGAAFSANGQKLYVNYTDKNGDTNVDEFTMNGAVAVKSSRRRVLFVSQPYANHNGGQMAFGPDGNLYIGLGDGGSGGDPQNRAQNKGTLLGKILRINPAGNAFTSYTTPLDNPFVGESGSRKEVWMYGLRNPWRFSFDKLTGDMWIGDVGQNAYEEIDYAPAGQKGINWGWNLREGFHAYNGAPPSGARDPIIERPHTAGDCAIIGGFVYRGAAIPALSGAYVYGDFCTGNVFAAVQSGGVVTQSRQLPINVPQLTSFGQDPSGELYATSDNGNISKIVP